VLGKEDAPPICIITNEYNTKGGRCIYPGTQLVIFDKKLYRCLAPRAGKQMPLFIGMPRRGLLGNWASDIGDSRKPEA
jgi:hypothetical protein